MDKQEPAQAKWLPAALTKQPPVAKEPPATSTAAMSTTLSAQAKRPAALTKQPPVAKEPPATSTAATSTEGRTSTFSVLRVRGAGAVLFKPAIKAPPMGAWPQQNLQEGRDAPSPVPVKATPSTPFLIFSGPVVDDNSQEGL